MSTQPGDTPRTEKSNGNGHGHGNGDEYPHYNVDAHAA